MQVESDIDVQNSLAGLSGARGDLLVHNGTSWVRLTGATQGSLLFRGASTWEYLEPGVEGSYLSSNGPAADLSYKKVGGIGDPVSLDPARATATGAYMFGQSAGAFVKTAPGSNVLAMVSGHIYAFPWKAPLTCTISMIAVNVSVTGTSLKLAIYADSNNLPGALIASSAAFAVSSGGYAQPGSTLSWAVTKDTVYWFAAAANAAVTLTSETTAFFHPSLGPTAIPAAAGVQYARESTVLKSTASTHYTTIPDPFPAASVSSTVTDVAPLFRIYIA